MRIDRADLERPMRMADPNLIELMERHAENLLIHLPCEDDFIGSMRKAIASCMHEGEPSIDIVAARIGRSRRTLQRELNTAGSSFCEGLNKLRREMALVYFRNPQLSLLDIAVLLGYTEQSAFSRSFKQWMGMSPKTYRAVNVSLD